jgi:hypothetical protein
MPPVEIAHDQTRLHAILVEESQADEKQANSAKRLACPEAIRA